MINIKHDCAASILPTLFNCCTSSYALHDNITVATVSMKLKTIVRHYTVYYSISSMVLCFVLTPPPPCPVVCSTDRSKAVVPVLVLLFVALWFILRGDLLYVFPYVILFLCFSVLLVLRLPRLGKRELILVLFVRLFGLCLFRFVGFLFLLGSGKGCGL